MKTKFYYITAILSMLMVALTGKAQEAEYEYVPVVREGVEWGYVASYHFPPGAEYYRLQLKGDTVINGKTYKRCYAYQTATLDIETATLHGFLREEDKRVYFIPNPEEENLTGIWILLKLIYEGYGDEERMIYDFNLNVGDTFCPAGHPVNIVDVFMVEVDGKLRKYFKDEYDAYSFLEGTGAAGSMCGELAYPFTDWMTNGAIVRFNFERNVADGRIVYKSEEFDDRDPTCAGESVAATMQSPAITITVAGKTVTVAADGSIMATIHDINGRTVATAQSADGNLTVDMDDFAPGIYIVTATTDTDRKTRKIIL